MNKFNKVKFKNRMKVSVPLKPKEKFNTFMPKIDDSLLRKERV